MNRNLVAFGRLGLLAPLFWLLLEGGQFHYWAALSVFMFVGLGGLVEGYVRKTPFSPFNAMLHVLADRLLTVVVVGGLIAAGLRDPLVLAGGMALIARDVIVGSLNEALPGSLETPVQGLERGRVALQVIGFGFLIAPNFALPDLTLPSQFVGSLCLVIAAILAIVTLTSYWRGAVAAFRAESET